MTITQLHDACEYLNSDRDAHLKAHGRWSLDGGKLQAALDHANITVDLLKLAELQDLRESLRSGIAAVAKAAQFPAEGVGDSCLHLAMHVRRLHFRANYIGGSPSPIPWDLLQERQTEDLMHQKQRVESLSEQLRETENDLRLEQDRRLKVEMAIRRHRDYPVEPDRVNQLYGALPEERPPT